MSEHRRSYNISTFLDKQTILSYFTLDDIIELTRMLHEQTLSYFSNRDNVIQSTILKNIINVGQKLNYNTLILNKKQLSIEDYIVKFGHIVPNDSNTHIIFKYIFLSSIIYLQSIFRMLLTQKRYIPKRLKGNICDYFPKLDCSIYTNMSSARLYLDNFLYKFFKYPIFTYDIPKSIILSGTTGINSKYINGIFEIDLDETIVHINSKYIKQNLYKHWYKKYNCISKKTYWIKRMFKVQCTKCTQYIYQPTHKVSFKCFCGNSMYRSYFQKIEINPMYKRKGKIDNMQLWMYYIKKTGKWYINSTENKDRKYSDGYASKLHSNNGWWYISPYLDSTDIHCNKHDSNTWKNLFYHQMINEINSKSCSIALLISSLDNHFINILIREWAKDINPYNFRIYIYLVYRIWLYNKHFMKIEELIEFLNNEYLRIKHNLYKLNILAMGAAKVYNKRKVYKAANIENIVYDNSASRGLYIIILMLSVYIITLIYGYYAFLSRNYKIQLLK